MISRLLPRGLILLLALCSVLTAETGFSQILQTPVNMGLGGGGAAYTTGYEALFINPANLHIADHRNRLQFSAGTAGLYTLAPERKERPVHYRDYLLGYTEGFSPDGGSSRVDPYDPATVLKRSFPDGRLLSENQTRAEVHWLGFHHRRERSSYAVALRSRYANRFRMGRHYVDDQPSTSGNRMFERSLFHQVQTLHEISFGYAESFEYINGLNPGMSRLIVGIAPKIMVGSGYQDVAYREHLDRIDSHTLMRRERSWRSHSAGAWSLMQERFLNRQNPFDPPVSWKKLLRPDGIGTGIDAGITWILPLNRELVAGPYGSHKTRNSVRLSLSVTDLGLIHYFRDPSVLETAPLVSETSQVPTPSPVLFSGRPGEHLYFLQRTGGLPLADAGRGDPESFTTLLPTAFHGGALFQWNRIKLTGDLSLSLAETAFHPSGLATYLGAEIRPLLFLPLRAGLRLAPNRPDYYSLGMGIESRYAELQTAIQLRRDPVGSGVEFLGLATTSLRLFLR